MIDTIRMAYEIITQMKLSQFSHEKFENYILDLSEDRVWDLCESKPKSMKILKKVIRELVFNSNQYKVILHSLFDGSGHYSSSDLYSSLLKAQQYMQDGGELFHSTFDEAEFFVIAFRGQLLERFLSGFDDLLLNLKLSL